MNTKPIQVWRFEDAPKKYHDLSTNGGDEDWIAFVPEYLCDEWIGWMECDSFGCYKIEKHNVEGGQIRIGCHA